MRESEFWRLFFPYCLDRQEDGTWLILNRNYKPVGITSKDWLDYKNHPARVKIKRLTQKVMTELSHDNIEKIDESRIYLYDDGSSPRTGAANLEIYMNKLKRLARLTVGCGPFP